MATIEDLLIDFAMELVGASVFAGLVYLLLKRREERTKREAFAHFTDLVRDGAGEYIANMIGWFWFAIHPKDRNVIPSNCPSNVNELIQLVREGKDSKSIWTGISKKEFWLSFSAWLPESLDFMISQALSSRDMLLNWLRSIVSTYLSVVPISTVSFLARTERTFHEMERRLGVKVMARVAPFSFVYGEWEKTISSSEKALLLSSLLESIKGLGDEISVWEHVVIGPKENEATR